MGAKLGRKSNRKMQYWIDLGYSEEAAMFESKKRTPGSFEYFKYFKNIIASDEDILKMSKEFKQDRAVTKSNMINKYGETEGLTRWEGYKQKQANTNSFEYKKKKYGWTKDRFDEYNQSRAVTKSNMIKRYGLEEGILKWEEYCLLQKTAGITLEYFINEYGIEEGTLKYHRMIRLKSGSYESYLEKFNSDIDLAIVAYQAAKISRKTKKPNSRPGHSSSKVSVELFDSIVDNLDLNNHKIFYFPFNQEWAFFKQDQSVTYVDFFDKMSGKVIEFYGDFWHGNPNVYESNTILNIPGANVINIQDQWKKDNDRIEYIKQFPYIKDVLIIWEQDYRKNKEQTINKCIQYLTT